MIKAILVHKSEISEELWARLAKEYLIPEKASSIYITVTDYNPRDISGICAFKGENHE